MSNSKAERLSILDQLSGEIPYTLTNDYMFRAIFQSNLTALKGLISATLALPFESIASVQILNPIELGKSIDEKTTILDIRVEMNNDTILNLEMQVVYQDFWAERSLLYLCRCFDNLKKGENYDKLKAAIHIGILDFTLFPENAKLHSQYEMRDIDTGYIYSSNFQLHVIDLKQINAAAKEENGELYCWAKLFKATTWEELKGMAKQSEGMMETVLTLHEMTEDEKIREQCAARERYERDWSTGLALSEKRGMIKGEKMGMVKGENRFASLSKKLMEEKRYEELQRAIDEVEYREELYKKYDL